MIAYVPEKATKVKVTVRPVKPGFVWQDMTPDLEKVPGTPKSEWTLTMR